MKRKEKEKENEIVAFSRHDVCVCVYLKLNFMGICESNKP